MSVVYVGSLTLGGCLPGALSATAAGDAAIALSLPQLQARIDALIETAASLTVSPPTFGATVIAVAQLAAGLELAGELPSISLQLTALATLIAALEAEAASLSAQASILVGLNLLLGTAGVHMYTGVGRAGDFAGGLGALTSGSGFGGSGAGAASGAIVLAATSSAARIALGTFVGVSL